MAKTIDIVVIIFLLFGCTKHVAGPKGSTGAAGENGNTIETHINSLTKDSTEWKVNNGIWETTVFIPELDNDKIFNSCEVKVYLDIDTTWWSLPRVDEDYITKYSIEKSYVRLEAYKFHGAPGHRPPTSNFRIVLLYPIQ